MRVSEGRGNAVSSARQLLVVDSAGADEDHARGGVVLRDVVADVLLREQGRRDAAEGQWEEAGRWEGGCRVRGRGG